MIKSRVDALSSFYRQAIETLLGRKLDESERESANRCRPVTCSGKPGDRRSLRLIGYDRSLRYAVEKGRAAVLYYRAAMLCWTGPSGVGKPFCRTDAPFCLRTRRSVAAAGLL